MGKGLRTFAILVLGVVFALSGSAAIAQDASPEAADDGVEMEMPPMFPETCSVVAEGLNEPRYIAIGEDGTIYVTEAGNGGDEILGVSNDASPEAAAGEDEESPPETRGFTGQVTTIAPDGTQSVLASGLPSYAGVGPVGIVDAGDALWVSIGGGAAGTAFFTGVEIEPLEFENSIVRIDKASGEVTLVAELGSYEVENNPDGLEDINPNLYGMTLGPDGMLYVTDAGGNTIYRVNPEDGSFEVVAVIPSMQELMGAEVPVNVEEVRQPVPLQPAFDAEGQLYVTLLSEAWEAPSIVTIGEDGTVTGIGEPGTFMFGLTTGPDGTVYLTQGTTMFDEESGIPQPGFVAIVGADGSLTPIVEGFFVPFGSVVDAFGNLYVTINAIAFAPGEPSGMLVKCDGVAAAA